MHSFTRCLATMIPCFGSDTYGMLDAW